MWHSSKYILNDKISKRYGDLSGIYSDIVHTKLLCIEIINFKGDMNDPILWHMTNKNLLECFVTTAVIKYSRCFNSGVRYNLSKELPNILDSSQIDVHNFIINYRNKHLSHSVNPFEENTVFYTEHEDYKNNIKHIDIEGISSMVVVLPIVKIRGLLINSEKIIEFLSKLIIKEKKIIKDKIENGGIKIFTQNNIAKTNNMDIRASSKRRK